jgi:hypothetical protein
MEVKIADDVSILSWITIPVLLWGFGRYFDRSGHWRFARWGTAIGVLVLPASLLAYLLFWLVPVVGIISGLPGLVSLSWHLLPFLGAFDELYRAFLQMPNPRPGAFTLWKPTLLWCLVYGSLGMVIDVRRHRQTKNISPRDRVAV